MRLYVVRGDLAFSLLRPVPEAPWPGKGGARVRQGWTPIDLEPYDLAEGDFVAVDCFGLSASSDGLILSDVARERLAPLLAPAGEFWPVRVIGLPYWWFNCLAVADVLDRQRTDAEWSTVQGSWGSFKWITSTRRLAFREEGFGVVPGCFRVPEYPQGVLFGSEALEAEVRTQELTGFRFDLVWTADDGGVEDPPGLGFGGMGPSGSMREQSRKRAWARSELARRGEGRG